MYVHHCLYIRLSVPKRIFGILSGRWHKKLGIPDQKNDHVILTLRHLHYVLFCIPQQPFVAAVSSVKLFPKKTTQMMLLVVLLQEADVQSAYTLPLKCISRFI